MGRGGLSSLNALRDEQALFELLFSAGFAGLSALKSLGCARALLFLLFLLEGTFCAGAWKFARALLFSVGTADGRRWEGGCKCKGEGEGEDWAVAEAVETGEGSGHRDQGAVGRWSDECECEYG